MKLQIESQAKPKLLASINSWPKMMAPQVPPTPKPTATATATATLIYNSAGRDTDKCSC